MSDGNNVVQYPTIRDATKCWYCGENVRDGEWDRHTMRGGFSLCTATAAPRELSPGEEASREEIGQLRAECGRLRLAMQEAREELGWFVTRGNVNRARRVLSEALHQTTSEEK